VRFLVDAQLPPALARHFRDLGHEADHVIDLGLAGARDQEVWNFALARSAIIVTKDEDFIAMRAIRERGPTVIWIRIGNTTTPVLLDALSVAWPAIEEALESGEGVIELT
jgi:predicted nuclease of predicted toxin-antitoxin system